MNDQDGRCSPIHDAGSAPQHCLVKAVVQEDERRAVHRIERDVTGKHCRIDQRHCGSRCDKGE